MRICLFTEKNLPKGWSFTDLKDPGMNYFVVSLWKGSVNSSRISHRPHHKGWRDITLWPFGLVNSLMLCKLATLIPKKECLGGGFKCVYLHPYLGEWSNLTNYYFFQMGWNHQLNAEKGDLFWNSFGPLRYIPSRSSTVRPWKVTFPTGKDRLPTTIFQGRAVKLRGGVS